MTSVRWLWLSLLLGAAGCEVTTFQNPPVAELACDSRLVGDWFSVADIDENSGASGELELQIDKACSMSIIEHDKQGDKHHEATPLHVGRDDEQGYAWLDYQWLSQSLFHGDNLHSKAQQDSPASASNDPVVPAGDVYVLRYSVQHKDLQLYQMDNHAIAHRIIDGKLTGDITKTGTVLFNRLTDQVTAEQLRRDVVFDPKPLRFTRDHPEPAK